MQKKIIFLLPLLLACFAGAAQVKYQGQMSAGYAFGVGSAGLNFVSLETAHGVRVNPYVFCGLGAGLNYYGSDESFNSHVYGEVRGYLLDRP